MANITCLLVRSCQIWTILESPESLRQLGDYGGGTLRWGG